MQAMLDAVAPKLDAGRADAFGGAGNPGLPEGAYGEDLGKLATRHPTVSIGSYPRLQEGRFVNQIVLRCLHAEALAAAESEVRALLAETAQRHRL